MSKSRLFFLLGGAVAVTSASITHAHATSIITGDLTNYAILTNGANGAGFTTNNSGINGNIGIGGTGTFSSSGGGNAAINGVLQFAAPNRGGNQFSTSAAGAFNPPLSSGVQPLYSVATVANAVTQLNALNASLTSMPATAPSFAIGGSTTVINLGTGPFLPNAQGIVVIPATAGGTNTLTINGDAAGDAVVFNLSGNNPQIGPTITLNNLTPDQVVINMTNSSGLRLQAAGRTQNVDYVDPLGPFVANSITINGRILGGGAQNSTFVSNGFIFAPAAEVPPPEIPVPAALPLFASGLGAFGLLGWRRKRKAQTVA